MSRRSLSRVLPTFPWDTIAAARQRASRHPDGLVDLSVGTPVDPTPQVVREALCRAADAHGYPQVWGTPQLRRAVTEHMESRWGAPALDETSVLPVVGTKEFVAHLPGQLGLGPGSVVVIPSRAYPTYRVGALLAGARVVVADDPDQVEVRPDLVWINSPSNPTGGIASPDLLRRWVDLVRRHDAVLVSDECYGEFAWQGEVVSVLDTRVSGGDLTGLLSCLSMSKRSNMAGYRAGVVVGDPALCQELLAVRKHSGLMIAAPVAEAMRAALADRDHVVAQVERYRRRREVLAEALLGAGYRIDDSQGSLYLWVTRGLDCRRTVEDLADLGILCSPGDFYVDGTSEHVRISLTATDDRIAAAARRLSEH